MFKIEKELLALMQNTLAQKKGIELSYSNIYSCVCAGGCDGSCSGCMGPG